MEFDINTSEIAIIVGIAVVAVLLAISILISPERAPKGDGDDQKGPDE